MERLNASSASVPLAHTSRHQKRTSNSCTTKPENRKAKKAPANNYKRPRQRSRLAPVLQPMHAADQSSSKSVNENFTSAARKLTSLSGFRGQDIFDPRLERASEGGLGIRGVGVVHPMEDRTLPRARLSAQRKDKRREKRPRRNAET